MKLFNAVSRALESAQRVSDLVRKTPRRRLDEVPAPPAPPEPFTRPREAGAAEKAPVGNPDLAAQVFGRRSCVFCGRAVALLQTEGVDYRFINLDDPDHHAVEADLIRETRQYTVPYVYLRGAFVGGYDELHAIVRAGELEQKTRARAPAG